MLATYEMIEEFAKEPKPNMPYWLAKNMGTSGAMTEKYSGLFCRRSRRTSYAAECLVGSTLLC